MIASAPMHFLLFADVRMKFIDNEEVGTWRFQLQSLVGDDNFSATGVERMISRDRLELLAVLRGLESLDQSSQVTLLTASRYVRKGFRQGLDLWRKNDWQWERFGRRVPIKNQDLWRRISNALQFHRVDCRLWRIDRQPVETRSSSEVSAQLQKRRRSIRPAEDRVEVEELQLAAG